MRRMIALGLVMLAASIAVAGQQWVELNLLCTNTQTNTATANVQGRIDTVYVEAPTTGGVAVAFTTGSVSVVSTPAVGLDLSSVTLYSNDAVTNTAVVARPRFAPTDAAGSALSTLTVKEPHLAVGDDVVFTVEQTAVAGHTNVLWRAFLKVTD